MTTPQGMLADKIRSGELALVFCHPEGKFPACDASQEQRDIVEAALARHPHQPVEDKRADYRETVDTLLALLNPLHGSLDRQTYDEKVAENFDAPRDREYAVDVTAQQERDLTQAVCILENRRAALTHPLEPATEAENKS